MKKQISENIIFINSVDELLKLKETNQQKQFICYKCNTCGKIRKTTIKNLIKNQNRFEKCRYCNSLNKKEQTCLKKYGVKNPKQSREIQEKIKQNCLERYGVENPAQRKEVKEKIKLHNLEKYGVDSPNSLQWKKDKTKETNLKKYGFEYPMQREYIKEKSKETCLEKYGTEIITQSKFFKEKSKETCLEKYGVEYALQSNEVREKGKQTKIEKYKDKNYNNREKAKQNMLKTYGVAYSTQSPKLQEKRKTTCLKKYGVDSFSKTSDFSKKRKSKYYLNNQYFDSKPELSFYIWAKDQGLNIIRNIDSFSYIYQNKEHKYFPDFKIDGNYYEIKGNQFLKEDGTWQNPFDPTQDALFETKHQCLIKNGVKILYSKEYQKYLNYINQKYGSKYLDQFKIVNKGVSNLSSKTEEIK